MATTIGEAVSEHAASACRLGSLTERSDAAGFAQLAGHVGVLVVTGYLVHFSIGTVWWPFALLGHGFVLIFLFAPLHETIHRTAFRSLWVNRLVSWFCGAVLMLPPDYFRAFHFAHHRYTQDPERDPELVYAKPSSWRSWLWTVSGIPYLAGADDDDLATCHGARFAALYQCAGAERHRVGSACPDWRLCVGRRGCRCCAYRAPCLSRGTVSCIAGSVRTHPGQRPV